MTRRLITPLILSVALGACQSRGGDPGDPTKADLSTAGSDGGTEQDLSGGGGTADLTGPAGSDLTSPPGTDLTSGNVDLASPQGGIPCSPGSYRCGANNAVEICNSTGTAWLYSASCAISCTNGLCTGACNPGDKRCNNNSVETCNAAGSTWTPTEMCTTFCDAARCAKPTLEVSVNTNLDGDILVAGDIVIKTGATLTSPSGNLSLTTRGAILVESGASIVVACTGQTPEGQGRDDNSYGGGGAGYGSSGGNARFASNAGPAYGSTTDAQIQAGARGGASASGRAGGLGGGVLKLLAQGTITVAGQITANACPSQSDGSYSGGGGAGGGVLIATPGNVVVSGAITAAGTSPAQGISYWGGTGGQGRVKILAGGTRSITGSANAVRTDGLIPPMTITSNSHPSQDLIYNDNFPSLTLAWNQAFNGRQGYYYRTDTTRSNPPTPANGRAVATESVTIMPSDLAGTSGGRDNYFHIVPIDASSNVGLVENVFRVRINNAPPTVASSSHMSSSTWYPSGDVFFSWTFPVADSNVKGVFYVLDHFGTHVPTSTDTFIPLPQKNLLRMGLAPGVWVMHVVAQDQRGYLTKVAGNLRVNVGADPGVGVLNGQVVDGGGKPVASASVTVNRGLYTTTTNAMGSYNFPNQIPAGMWEIRASSADGLLTDTKSDTVTKGGSTTVNLTLK